MSRSYAINYNLRSSEILGFSCAIPLDCWRAYIFSIFTQSVKNLFKYFSMLLNNTYLYIFACIRLSAEQNLFSFTVYYNSRWSVKCVCSRCLLVHRMDMDWHHQMCESNIRILKMLFARSFREILESRNSSTIRQLTEFLHTNQHQIRFCIHASCILAVHIFPYRSGIVVVVGTLYAIQFQLLSLLENQ